MKTIKKTEPTNPMQILVVDDDENIRKLTQIVLEEAGYGVDVVETVAAAQQKLTEKEYDIVMTDIVLPEISGMELLKIVHETFPDIPVILMTGFPAVETASEAIRNGSTVDYLIKPFTTESNVICGQCSPRSDCAFMESDLITSLMSDSAAAQADLELQCTQIEQMSLAAAKV